MTSAIMRRVARPIDKLRVRAGMSALRAAVLRDKLDAAETAAQRDGDAVAAEEARQAEGMRGSLLRRARRDAERAFEIEGGR